MNNIVKSGPTIVMLHGWAAHKGFFSDLIEELPPQYNVVVPDLPGHGANVGDSNRRSIRDIALWLNIFLEKKNIQQPVLLGWSMGAMVALEYVKNFGEHMCKGLVLLDMSPCILNDENWKLGLLGGLDAKKNQKSFDFIAGNWAGYCKGMLPLMFASGSPLPEKSKWVHEEMLKSDPQTMAHYWNSLTEQDYRQLLPNITIPSLVISGGKSALYSLDTAKYFSDNMQNSKLVVCENSGHALLMEEPKKVAQYVDEYMESLTGSS